MMKSISILVSLLGVICITARPGKAASAGKVRIYRGVEPRVTSIGVGETGRLLSDGRLDPDEYRISDARVSDTKYLPRAGKRLSRELRLAREELRKSEKTGSSNVVSSYVSRIGREEIKQRKKERLLLF